MASSLRLVPLPLLSTFPFLEGVVLAFRYSCCCSIPSQFTTFHPSFLSSFPFCACVLFPGFPSLRRVLRETEDTSERNEDPRRERSPGSPLCLSDMQMTSRGDGEAATRPRLALAVRYTGRNVCQVRRPGRSHLGFLQSRIDCDSRSSQLVESQAATMVVRLTPRQHLRTTGLSFRQCATAGCWLDQISLPLQKHPKILFAAYLLLSYRYFPVMLRITIIRLFDERL